MFVRRELDGEPEICVPDQGKALLMYELTEPFVIACGWTVKNAFGVRMLKNYIFIFN